MWPLNLLTSVLLPPFTGFNASIKLLLHTGNMPRHELYIMLPAWRRQRHAPAAGAAAAACGGAGGGGGAEVIRRHRCALRQRQRQG